MNLLVRDTSTPALVLGSAHHGALAITRSLGRLGVRVYNLDKSRWAPAFSSRYCRESLVWNLEEAPPSHSVDYLLEIARRIGRPCVLIPITDAASLFLADHANVLRESFLFPKQDPGLVRALYNKKLMHRLAAGLDIPSASVFFPQSLDGLREYLASAKFPLVLKATDGIRMEQRGLPTKAILHNRGELQKILELLEDSDLPDVMLQEYIPGGPESVWMFDGYFDEDSECLFGMTGRKLRQYPAYTGASSLAVCAPNETVEKTTRRFMKAIGYRGVLDIGFRFDQRDGLYKVLDVNPRVGTSFRLFTDEGGLDVVRALYLHLTGQPVLGGKASWGRRWIVEDLDMMSTVRYFRAFCRTG